MTDKKTVGSVTYQNAGKDYFEKRRLKRHARVWSLWALGVGAVISGPLLRLELRHRRRRLGRPVHRRDHHRDHVSRPDLQSRRNVAGAAAHRRRVFLRAQRDGTVGRLHHRARREHRVHHDARRHRVLHRLVPHRNFRNAGDAISRCGGSAATSCSSRSTTGASKLSFKISVIVTLLALAVLVVFWVSAIPFADFRSLGAQHRRRPRRRADRACRRRRRVPAERLDRRARRAAVRGLAVPRDRRAAARCGRIGRSEEGHAEGPDLRHVHADLLGADDHVPERIDRRARKKASCTAHFRSRPRPSRCSTASA